MSAKDEDEALEGLFALRCGTDPQKEAFVRGVQHLLGRKLQRYFERHRVPQDDAEEMVWDVLYRSLTGEFRGESLPRVWLWTIARNLMIGYHRHGRDEVLLDEEGWEAVMATLSAAEAPAWAKLCLERALAEFEADHPERAQLLRLIVEDWSAREIGEFLGCKEGAARDRVYRARDIARDYLIDCQEAQ